MIRTIRKALKQAANIVAEYLAPYNVHCCHGTFKPCWSLKTAREWMAVAGNYAVITSRYYGGEVIESRRFVRVY